MKKLKFFLISFFKILFLTNVNSTPVSAASMYDNWANNSYIVWNYTTQGGIVYAAQRILNSAGMALEVPGFNISDGYYGTNTYNAIYRYQSDYGLGSDGIIGPNTMDKLSKPYILYW
ncbi:peptidoglycan-binding domain-containing protein [Clostridium sp. LBM24168]